MRSIWNGTIGFGLVSIPIKMYSATNQERINLDMLDKEDHSRIRYQRVNENTGKEVKWADIVKGFQLDGEYIVLTDEDFEKANAKKTKSIEIDDFVEEKEIDSIYFDKPYYLEPTEAGRKPYALLREALNKTGKVGVATFVLRQKENLAILRPMREAIVLNKIRFQEEIRDIADLNLPKEVNLDNKQVDMAIQLIDQYTTEFDISAYKDTYSEQLKNLIQEKAKGQVTKKEKVEKAPTKSKDLMAQLKASLEQKKKKAS
ncbi:MAG: Ku protein [Balneolales bacterium]